MKKNVKHLTAVFGLEYPSHRIEITRYGLDDHDRIIIEEAKIFDKHDNFVKLADKSKLINSIDKYPVSFKKD